MEGKEVTFTVDSGSPVSIVPRHLVKGPLTMPKESMSAYGGSKLEVSGMKCMSMSSMEKTANVCIYVVPKGRALMSLDLMEVFSVNIVGNRVYAVSTAPSQSSPVLERTSVRSGSLVTGSQRLECASIQSGSGRCWRHRTPGREGSPRLPGCRGVPRQVPAAVFGRGGAPPSRAARGAVRLDGGTVSSAVRRVKDAIREAPALAMFDPTCPTVLATDASDVDCGACITQVDASGKPRVIVYASKTFTAAERNYSVVVKEAVQSARLAKEQRAVFLKRFLAEYRATPHPVTGETPFVLMRGQEPRTVLDVLPSDPCRDKTIRQHHRRYQSAYKGTPRPDGHRRSPVGGGRLGQRSEARKRPCRGPAVGPDRTQDWPGQLQALVRRACSR